MAALLLQQTREFDKKWERKPEKRGELILNAPLSVLVMRRDILRYSQEWLMKRLKEVMIGGNVTDVKMLLSVVHSHPDVVTYSIASNNIDIIRLARIHSTESPTLAYSLLYSRMADLPSASDEVMDYVVTNMIPVDSRAAMLRDAAKNGDWRRLDIFGKHWKYEFREIQYNISIKHIHLILRYNKHVLISHISGAIAGGTRPELLFPLLPHISINDEFNKSDRWTLKYMQHHFTASSAPDQWYGTIKVPLISKGYDYTKFMLRIMTRYNYSNWDWCSDLLHRATIVRRARPRIYSATLILCLLCYVRRFKERVYNPDNLDDPTSFLSRITYGSREAMK